MTTKKASTSKRSPQQSAINADPKADAEFASILKEFCGKPGVTPAKMFGASALKVNGKVFAMLTKGKLVVKLPRERAAVLVASREGEYFDPGHGRLMKEWVEVQPPSTSKAKWRSLMAEAQKFVASIS